MKFVPQLGFKMQEDVTLLKFANEFLFHIVTGVETLISYVNVETKQQSVQWHHSEPPKPKKFKQISPRRIIMATVFYDPSQESSASVFHMELYAPELPEQINA